jgi:hypothetical protein
VQGSTLKHDGSQVVVFTKQEYRQLQGPISTGLITGSAPVDEGEEAGEDQQSGAGWARGQGKTKKQKTARGASSGGKGQRRPTRGRKQQQGQQTLEDVVAKMGRGR